MISILLPSRGRPENVRRLWRSAYDTSINAFEFIVRLDNDDPDIGFYPTLPSTRYLVGARGEGNLSAMWNECYTHASGEVLMHCGDDIVFRSPGWDVAVTEAFPPDGIAFVHGSDGSGCEEIIGTHGFLRREWVDAVGYFVPPYFASDYNDKWLTEVADALGRRVIVPVLTEHLHPAHGKAEWDQTHRERIARHLAQDCDAIWAATAEERDVAVDKLREVMT